MSTPPTAHAEGIAPEVLEHLWCAEIFLMETRLLERDGTREMP